jgi:sugar-specific transcriptional regulator TrmB
MKEELILEEYHLETLIQLGLTPNQSRLYLSLLSLGKAIGKTIPKETGFARQEVYRILEELHDRGLIEKSIATPTEFRAIKVEEAISILLLEKTKKLEQTKDRIQSLIDKYSPITEITPQNEYKFLLIPPKTLVNETREKMLEKAKTNVQLITTKKRFLQGISHFFEAYESLLKRNVKTQIIVNTAGESNSLETDKLQPLKKSPNFSLRIISQSKTNILIVDKSEAIITLHPEVDLGASPALWTNHPEFLAVFQDYFEGLWKKTTKR